MDAMFIAIAVKILVNYSVNSHKFCGLFHMYFLSSGKQPLAICLIGWLLCSQGQALFSPKGTDDTRWFSLKHYLGSQLLPLPIMAGDTMRQATFCCDRERDALNCDSELGNILS